MGLLDEVRAHAEGVAKSARFVGLKADGIEAYAASLPLSTVQNPELDAATHYLGPPDPTLAFVLTLDAINFGSGYFPKLTKRPGLSGYFTVAVSLKDVYEQRGPLSADQLKALTQSDCAGIFGQTDNDDPAVAELMGLFSRALNDLGTYVADRFGGSFRALVTAADLSIAGVAQFTDLDRLTIFADNLVPHVLRVDGILAYEPGLLERIEREELIPAGSPEELEIRAGAVYAVELIGQAIRSTGREVSSMQLDYLLWNRGQAPAYKTQPRHRTRTVFY